MFAKVRKFAVALIAPLAVSSTCLAGTGGIFPTTNQSTSTSSPLPAGNAGLPPASETPMLRGINNAPLPASASGAADTNLPLRGLPNSAPAGQITNPQSLSGSATTRRPEAGGKPALLQSGSPALLQSGSPALQQGTVESFFQVSPAPRSARPAASGADTAKLGENQDEHKKSVKRFLWHALDNIGVPMFFGNKDDDLDPSLAHGYIMRSENGARAAQASNQDKATANSAVVNQPSVHKIPDSELEGVNFSVKNDAQSATP
jgi:hypothetical protein